MNPGYPLKCNNFKLETGKAITTLMQKYNPAKRAPQ